MNITMNIRVWLRRCLSRHSLGVVAHNVFRRLVQMLVPSLLTIDLNNYHKRLCCQSIYDIVYIFWLDS